jgi:hypothetical protein
VTGGTSATVDATATIHEQLLADGTVGTPDQNYIQEIYRDLFGRQAEMHGLDYWVAELVQGVPRQQVAFQMVKIASFEEFQHDTVAALYQQYLGRAPDAGGLAYWSAYLYDGGTIEGMSQALVSSPEYRQTRAQATVDVFVNALFHDALGRAIDPAALTYFTGLMAQGASGADVAAVVFSSDEYHRQRVDSLFGQFMDRPTRAPLVSSPSWTTAAPTSSSSRNCSPPMNTMAWHRCRPITAWDSETASLVPAGKCIAVPIRMPAALSPALSRRERERSSSFRKRYGSTKSMRRLVPRSVSRLICSRMSGDLA